MGDVGLGRRGDVADVVESGEVGLAILGQAVDDVGAQVGGRFEEVDDPFGSQPRFECLKFDRTLAFFDVCHFDGVLFVHEEDQAGDAALDGAVVFHFGDGDVVAFGDVAVAVGKDAEIDVGIIDHLQRCRDGFGSRWRAGAPS